MRIHIDRERHESPSPTSGEALYKLGRVAEGRGLFREVSGDREDEFIPRIADAVHLHEDEHFYSEIVPTIYVEGIPHQWPKPDISYDQVVELEVPDYRKHPEITYSVTYKDGYPKHPEGVLSKGAKIKVVQGMKFNVSETGQS